MFLMDVYSIDDNDRPNTVVTTILLLQKENVWKKYSMHYYTPVDTHSCALLFSDFIEQQRPATCMMHKCIQSGPEKIAQSLLQRHLATG